MIEKKLNPESGLVKNNRSQLGSKNGNLINDYSKGVRGMNIIIICNCTAIVTEMDSYNFFQLFALLSYIKELSVC